MQVKTRTDNPTIKIITYIEISKSLSSSFLICFQSIARQKEEVCHKMKPYQKHKKPNLKLSFCCAYLKGEGSAMGRRAEV